MTMTREEAITIIDNLHLIGCGRNQHENDLKINIALDMAIEALQTEQRGECRKDCRCYYHDLEDGDTLYKLESWDGGMDFVYIRDIKFCPICGRKLEGEAEE